MFDRFTLWAGDGLDPSHARDMEDVFGDAVDDKHVRRVAHIVIGFDQQKFRIHPGLREMPIRGGVADVGRNVWRQVLAIVVIVLIRRQRQ